MPKSKPIFEKFLLNKESWKDKWSDFLNSPVNFNDSHFKEELTPFYGTSTFNDFSDQEKLKLFYAYIKLVTEAQIMLEQVLIYGFFYFRNKRFRHDGVVQDSIEKLQCEELHHSQAFRHFLAESPQLQWPKERIFPFPRFIRSLLAWVMKKAPLGMTLPGAKIEAFSMAYFKLLKKAYPEGEREHSWYHLNHYHHIDESFHVPLEFDLYNDSIWKSGPIRSFLSTLFFIIFLQYALALGSWNLVRIAFNERSPKERIGLFFGFMRWAIRHMPAFEETRLHTKSLFKKKRPLFGNILSFMHW